MLLLRWTLRTNWARSVHFLYIDNACAANVNVVLWHFYNFRKCPNAFFIYSIYSALHAAQFIRRAHVKSITLPGAPHSMSEYEPIYMYIKFYFIFSQYTDRSTLYLNTRVIIVLSNRTHLKYTVYLVHLNGLLFNRNCHNGNYTHNSTNRNTHLRKWMCVNKS